MTTRGYALPDPNKPDRLSVWFSGGKMECGEAKSSQEFQVWKRIFGDDDQHDGEKYQAGIELGAKCNTGKAYEEPKKHKKRKSHKHLL